MPKVELKTEEIEENPDEPLGNEVADEVVNENEEEEEEEVVEIKEKEKLNPEDVFKPKQHSPTRGYLAIPVVLIGHCCLPTPLVGQHPSVAMRRGLRVEMLGKNIHCIWIVFHQQRT